MLAETGHLLLIFGLVSSLIVVFTYLFYGKTESGRRNARIFYSAHVVTVLGVISCLWLMLFWRQYQYDYVWNHASNDLTIYYLISCFWEGQEGSFLIWILWNALLGLILINKYRDWEREILIVFSAFQVLMISLVLGVYLFPELKIGSSPFLLLKDTSSNEIFKIDPGFVPLDGTGLNPLLQNIWMVIHPPVIFLGYALSGIPFVLVIAGLLKNEIDLLFKRIQIWLLITVGVIGAGIMMGAYWAYETLNFGGYWNWDPVENAVLIPWIVLVAALHGVILVRKKAVGQLFSVILVCSGFVLVLYATFLTRSGILGDSSVHAFTDLGLSGQLLLVLVLVLLFSIGILVFKRHLLINTPDENTENQFQNWMTFGVLVLILASFQVLVPTSIPVLNVIFQNIGLTGDMAPPSDPIAFYSKFQLWFAIGFAILSTGAQYIYHYNIKDRSTLESKLFFSLMGAIALSAMIILFARVYHWQYAILLFSCLFSVISSVLILSRSIKIRTPQLSGTLAHGGFSVLLIGVIFSAGYKKVISSSMLLNAPESNLPVHTIQENTLLNRHQSKLFGNYQITFTSVYQETNNQELIDLDDYIDTTNPKLKVLKEGEHERIVDVEDENTYYELQVTHDGVTTYLKPRMQNNPTMGFIASPAIQSFWNKDLYVHVTNFPDPEKQEWKSNDGVDFRKGDSLNYGSVKIHYAGSQLTKNVPGVTLEKEDLAVESQFVIQDGDRAYHLNPIYLIRGEQVRLFPAYEKALGIRILVNKHNVENGSVEVTIAHSERDWVTIKAIEMPMINLVWTGAIIVCFGVFWGVLAKFDVTQRHSVIKESKSRRPVKIMIAKWLVAHK